MEDTLYAITDPHNSWRVAIISPKRGRRPELYRKKSACPFCPGNEDQTPPATLVQVLTGDGGIRYTSDRNGVVREWNARCFPNKYPALLPREELRPGRRGEVSVYGYHEVLVETRIHSETEYLRSPRALYYALHAARERGRMILEDTMIESVVVIKNYGAQSGGSIPHPHMQLFALTYTPPQLRAEVETFARSRLCPLCSSSIYRRLVVYSNRGFTVSLAPAPRAPYEMIIVPRRHSPSFLDAGDSELMELADALRLALLFIVEVLGRNYNYWIHTAPRGAGGFHWHVEVMPKTESWGGFEKGSGAYIIPADIPSMLEEARRGFSELSS